LLIISLLSILFLAFSFAYIPSLLQSKGDDFPPLAYHYHTTEMASSHFKPLALAWAAFSSIVVVSGFDGITIGSTIAGGKDAPVHITNDFGNGDDSLDAVFSNYRVYLSITPPGWHGFPNPSCYLINSSKIDVTDFDVDIPAAVGPSGSTYSLVTLEYHEDPNDGSPSGYLYSGAFDLTAATGYWSQYELFGHRSLGDPDHIPCSAYECARNCNQKYYPANLNDVNAYENTYECVIACPGVTPWDSSSAADGTNTFGSSGSSSTGTGNGSTYPASNLTDTSGGIAIKPVATSNTTVVSPTPTHVPASSANRLDTLEPWVLIIVAGIIFGFGL
jgi:hypothetical protein